MVMLVLGSVNEGCDFNVFGIFIVCGVCVGVIEIINGSGVVVIFDGVIVSGRVVFYQVMVIVWDLVIIIIDISFGISGYVIIIYGLVSGGVDVFRSVFMLVNSQIIGGIGGLQFVVGGIVNVVGSMLIGGVNGVCVIVGFVEFCVGFRVIGGINGLLMMVMVRNQFINFMFDDWYVFVDGSIVQGQMGSVIWVNLNFMLELVCIMVQNDVILLGGNGNLVEVVVNVVFDFMVCISIFVGDFIMDVVVGDIMLWFLDGLWLMGCVWGGVDVIVD